MHITTTISNENSLKNLPQVAKRCCKIENENGGCHFAPFFPPFTISFKENFLGHSAKPKEKPKFNYLQCANLQLKISTG